MNHKNIKIVEIWLKKADHDIGMALLAIESGEDFTDSICFHCQQFVEKILKAYLIKAGLIPRSSAAMTN